MSTTWAPRTLEMKKTTLVDTVEYLRTLPNDPAINELLDVLEVAAESFQLQIDARAITEVNYYRHQIAKMNAAELLADHIDDYRTELEGFTVMDVPVDLVQLIFLCLSDSLDVLSNALLLGRRTRGWQPIDTRELDALERYGLMA